MPSARELLEQADALMRRNRAADTSIPVLTDVVEPPRVVAAPATRSGTTISPAMKAQRGEPMAQPSATRQWGRNAIGGFNHKRRSSASVVAASGVSTRTRPCCAKAFATSLAAISSRSATWV